MLSLKSYDFILTDYKMTDGSGLDLIRKKNELGLDVPIAMMTGFANIQLLKDCIQGGIIDYIEKPCEPNVLGQKVSKILKDYQYKKQLKRFELTGFSLAEVLHDLCTPLGTILMASERVNENLKSLEKIDKAVEMNHIITKTANSLIQSIRQLQSSILEEQKSYKPLSLISFFSKLSSAYFNKNRSNMTVTILKPDSNCHFLADEYKVLRVLQNLINNALDAVPAETSGWVEVRFSSDHENVYFHVANSGPKIPIELHEKIFNPLYSTKKKSSGSYGLGLSICGNIALEHKGRVYLDNSALHTTFIFSLPRLV